MSAQNLEANKLFPYARALVFGLGVSGKSALKLLNQLSLVQIGVVEKNTPDLSSFSSEIQSYKEEDLLKSDEIGRYEVMILAPGIPRSHSLVKLALSKNLKVISEIQLGNAFLAEEKVIALTGTNGKTTTAMMVEHLLKENGITCFLGGNIGTPLCDYALSVLKGGECVQSIVLELSSFQLESTEELKLSCAAILNLSFSHGERYKNMQEYWQAKKNLFVLGQRNKAKLFADKSVSSYLESNEINNLTVINSFSPVALSLPGDHNQLNAHFARELVKSVFTVDTEKLATFKGPPHRIERVNGKFFIAYNDSKSTNFDSLMRAVWALKDEKNLVLLMGGKLRGEGDDISPYLGKIVPHVRHFILFGEASESLGRELRGHLDLSYSIYSHLEAALWDYIAHDFQEGDTLLFSPGFPSFDEFKNYEHRGNIFKQIIRSLVP